MLCKTFQNNIVTLYGDTGKRWLDNLQPFLKQCEQKLHIKFHAPFKQLTYNYVAPVTLANGSAAVFKCGAATVELNTEIAALHHFAGNAAVKLIDANTKEGWLLLEKLIPGKMLLSLKDDDEATRIAAQVMRKLWRPLDHSTTIFPSIKQWLIGFDRLYQQFYGKSGPFPKALVAQVTELSKDLLKSQTDPVLLHGDFQHYNILSATREPWLSIDPKGVVGEREFEVGAFMKNPKPLLSSTKNCKELFTRRFDIITEITGLDRQKMTSWSFVMAMLSAWWDFEGHGTYNKLLIHCAENLRELL